ncbi:MAG: MBL fold metallo-hydrolase [Flavobacteriales bacterium]|nr:MBL fold metallo-hydrolase [Flavobacteriales bacterium]
MEKVTVHFLGAAGTVTGSKFLVETNGMRIMVDCGMFQGVKSLRELNWQYLPVDASTIDVVLLTHGHMDHSGWLPRLVKMGFKGKIIATRPTLQIAEVILRDSAKIQMEDADRANREEFTEHSPAEPLYDMDDVEHTLKHFKAIHIKEEVELSEIISARFINNGHIIGSTFIELKVGEKLLVFSGDIGRNDDLLMHRPERPTKADVLFIESTYGDRLHPQEDTKDRLRELITRTVALGGTVMIPSFAVERAQTLMYLLWQLRLEKAIPHVPFIMDSPMGANVLDVFRNNPEWHRLSFKDCEEMCHQFDIIRDYKDTMEQVADLRPKVVVAGSGMVTGGRVLAYMAKHLERPESMVLLAGYQAAGTRGRQLQEGATEIKFHGNYHQVKCHLEQLEGLSAHADQAELLDWMGELEEAPQQVFVIHGEALAADNFRLKIKERFGYQASVPMLHDIVELQLE